MERPELRFLVVRRDVDVDALAVVGDAVVTYELDEPFPYAYLPSCAHVAELEEYMASVDFGSATWREESALHCTNCPRGRGKKIASVVVHQEGARRWVSPRPEKLPTGFAPRDPDSWPLHGEPGRAPHIGDVASCPGCRKRWLVVSFHDRAELIGIKRARYGETIVE